MQKEGYIKKHTFYLAIIATLIVGFIGGVLYSVYHSPAVNAEQQAGVNNANTEELIAQLIKNAEGHPDEALHWVELGHAYFDTGQAEKAIESYNKALAIEPGNNDVRTDLGIMYFQNKQPKEAITMFDQALTADPKHPQARFNKGVVLLNALNDEKGALQEWKTLLQVQPEFTVPSGQKLRDLVDGIEKKGN